MLKNSKIYIAGHKGLVGSAILNNLSAKGYYNLVYKTHKELDLINQRKVEDFFSNEKPEYVILAAAKVGGIVANNTYRADFIYENIMIQNNVIHNAYKYGVKKLLFLGSTCIYPKLAPQPIQEDSLLTSELEPTNEPYAIAKIAGIKMCESYNIQYGTNYISVMPTNLYGPNDNFDLEKSHVLPALIRKIHLGKCLNEGDFQAIISDLNNNPIEGVDGNSSKDEIINVINKYGITKSSIDIWGSGNPMREFLWSEDMADACVFLLNNCSSEDLENKHINIGTGMDISIKDLANMIKKEIGYQGSFNFDTTKPDGTMKKLTDVSKINQLGWKHSIEIMQGVKKLYSWYINNI
mgnify:CR=1 FL=1